MLFSASFCWACTDDSALFTTPNVLLPTFSQHHRKPFRTRVFTSNRSVLFAFLSCRFHLPTACLCSLVAATSCRLRSHCPTALRLRSSNMTPNVTPCRAPSKLVALGLNRCHNLMSNSCRTSTNFVTPSTPGPRTNSARDPLHAQRPNCTTLHTIASAHS